MNMVDFYIDPTKIIIFSKTTCGFCKKAKELFNKLGYTDLTIYELDQIREGTNLQGALKQKTNQTTVPNIFLYGIHVGGYDDLYSLYESNRLMNYQKKSITYLCSFCGKESDNKDFSCKCFQIHYDEWGRPL